MPKESKASSTSKGRGGKYASVAKFMKSDNCKNVVLMVRLLFYMHASYSHAELIVRSR